VTSTPPPRPQLGNITTHTATSVAKIPTVATPNPSLIGRKERCARKMSGRGGRAISLGNPPVRLGPRSSDRLPPGQHLTQGFPILDLGIKPEIALKEWRL